MNNDIKLPPEAAEIINRLEENRHEAYAVGGCVRDSILGKKPDDWDITTDAEPKKTEKIFSDFRVIETGIKHGTVTVIIGGTPYEITTFRKESGYSDRRHPDSVLYTDKITDDLSRRDFTMNAVAFSQKRGFIDPYGGINDIKDGIIRCIGEPDRRFSEDALRILRALRFASVTGFEIEEKTARSLVKNKELLSAVSSERLRDETGKLLTGKNVFDVLIKYPDVLSVYIPCIAPSIGFAQRNPHHIYDVFTHIARVVKETPPTLCLRLAALFHDIGKPSCFTVDENGVGHFRGHGAASVELARDALESLKFDNFTKERVLTLIKHHDAPIEVSERAVRRALNRLSPEVFFELLSLKRADNMAQAPEYMNRLGDYDALEKLAVGILNEKKCFSLADLAVGGNDIMSLGYSGKEVGAALDFLLDAVIDSKVANEKEALLAYLGENMRGFI